MNRIQLRSRLIAAVAYDLPSSRLVIEFTDGKIVPYPNVPEQIFRNLLSAESPGSYYRHHRLERGPRPYTHSSN